MFHISYTYCAGLISLYHLSAMTWEATTTTEELATHTAIHHRYPQGLTLTENLLSPEDYDGVLRSILSAFQAIECDTSEVVTPRGAKKPKRKRTAIHYGPQFDYLTNHVVENPTPIPDWMAPIITKLPVEINQATLQYYPPGAGIPPHIDTHSCFGSHIILYSAGLAVSFEFKPATSHTAEKMFAPRRIKGGPSMTPKSPSPDLNDLPEAVSQAVEVLLPGNSLCVMENEVRYAWTHGIRSRATDTINGQTVPRGNRFSITFRYVSFDGVCKCQFPKWCDTRHQAENTPNT